MRLKSPNDLSLLEVLALLAPESSRNTLRSWIEKGRVTIDGKEAKKASMSVKKGEEVCIGKKVNFISREIKVFYEDQHLIVIEKPAGLLSVMTNTDETNNAHYVLKRRFHSQRVYPVHRLDRDTSGVMVFAYSEGAREGLKAQFMKHSIYREYTAVVEGKIDPIEGTWKSYLREDRNYYVKSAPEGQLAITHYKMIKQNKQFSLLSLQLETGRKNQIRVHASEAGFPILGDIKYGKTKRDRLYLHAAHLAFDHPVLRKKLSFESKAPESFYSLIK
ncbi:MAG TPA: RluA family pseudouridine synthase [Rhabdochlamydiaceae bacterium]|nr:RluA family pseudouridine synthase [Rhabdochlamydiaceae bacterium]